MKNNQKGITLIALVVTIIVLLILAGVSIAMITGEGGILGRASEAGWKTQLADAEGIVSLTVSNYLADYWGGQYTSTASTLATDATSADDAVDAALDAAETELGSNFNVYSETTAAKKFANGDFIYIVYKSGADAKAKYYKVKGTLNGSIVSWSAMESATADDFSAADKTKGA